MPRQGTAARKRARLGLSPAKPGRLGWVHGTKLAFMRERMEGYRRAAELGKVQAGRFYRDVADEYLKIYGDNIPWSGDLEEGLSVSPDAYDEDEDVDDLPAEVSEARAVYYNDLREKIGVWFRTNAGKGGGKKAPKGSSFKTLLGRGELDPVKPVRARTLHYYSRRFYKERVKARFDARWAAVQTRAKPPAAIAVHNEVIKESWEAETEPFKAEMLACLEAEHKAAMEAHEKAVSGEAPTSPEEFQIAIDNIGYYLQPFVNAVQERLGMNVTLLACGPVPNRGGAIELLSVHAGMSKGLVPRIWPEFDRGGFEATRRSFRKFSDHCFSTEERLERSLPGMAEMAASEDGVGEISHESRTGSEGPAPVMQNATGSVPREAEQNEGDDGEENDDGKQNEGDDGEENDDAEENEDGEENDDGEQNEGDDGEWPATGAWTHTAEDLEELESRLEPDLAAEMALREPGEERWRAEARILRLSAGELFRENNLARNRRLMKELMGENTGFFPTEKENNDMGGKGKKKRASARGSGPKGSPRVTRSRKNAVVSKGTTRDDEDHDEDGDYSDKNEGEGDENDDVGVEKVVMGGGDGTESVGGKEMLGDGETAEGDGGTEKPEEMGAVEENIVPEGGGAGTKNVGGTGLEVEVASGGGADIRGEAVLVFPMPSAGVMALGAKKKKGLSEMVEAAKLARLAREADGEARRTPTRPTPKPTPAWRGAAGEKRRTSAGGELRTGTSPTLASSASNTATTSAHGQPASPPTLTPVSTPAPVSTPSAPSATLLIVPPVSPVRTGVGSNNAAAPTSTVNPGELTAVGVEAQNAGGEDVWEVKEEWPQELRNAVQACGRLKEFGGVEWAECVGALLRLEEAWGFPGKGMRAAPSKPESGRPSEVAAFMKDARKWEKILVLEVDKDGNVGEPGPREVEGSMSRRFWDWWGRWQPVERREEGEKLTRPGDLSEGVWEDIGMTHGRNGLLLVVGCLLWWGDAAAAEQDASLLAPLREDWMAAVSDVKWVLKECMKGVGAVVKRIAAEKVSAEKAEKARRKEESKENTKARTRGADAGGSGVGKRKKADELGGEKEEGDGTRLRKRRRRGET